MSVSINTFRSCYIIGIGGSGMSSIAKYLFQKGLEVSGYDQRSSYITNLLNNDGIKVDFDISNASYSSETLYIVSSAINMESTFLSDFVNQPNVLTRPNFLKLLSSSVDVIGITGTHGKTSTTALLAHMFKFNEIDISYIYGGVTSFNGIGGHYGDKNLPLLLETDEAFNTFKDVRIKNLLVTNIDHEHIDYFESFENLPENIVKKILFAMSYFIDDEDEIPDIVPKYGYLDDIVVVRWIVTEINKELPEIGVA